MQGMYNNDINNISSNITVIYLDLNQEHHLECNLNILMMVMKMVLFIG